MKMASAHLHASETHLLTHKLARYLPPGLNDRPRPLRLTPAVVISPLLGEGSFLLT
jgi:hypothetical protein